MTFAGGHWTLTRQDPDFYQRFVADVEPDRIHGRWDASDDGSRAWQQDYELTFVRS